tara:strand:+ start:204 stop:503 length:300 start_codon:yes stop_codon:yes gene_type:complete
MNANRRGGFPAPRTQFINNGFGLGEFFSKRGLNERHCLPRSNWATFKDWPTKIYLNLTIQRSDHTVPKETRTLEVITFDRSQHYYETNPTSSHRFLIDD